MKENSNKNNGIWSKNDKGSDQKLDYTKTCNSLRGRDKF